MYLLGKHWKIRLISYKSTKLDFFLSVFGLSVLLYSFSRGSLVSTTSIFGGCWQKSLGQDKLALSLDCAWSNEAVCNFSNGIYPKRNVFRQNALETRSKMDKFAPKLQDKSENLWKLEISQTLTEPGVKSWCKSLKKRRKNLSQKSASESGVTLEAADGCKTAPTTLWSIVSWWKIATRGSEGVKTTALGLAPSNKAGFYR